MNNLAYSISRILHGVTRNNACDLNLSYVLFLFAIENILLILIYWDICEKYIFEHR